jgi:hypothetical protein
MSELTWKPSADGVSAYCYYAREFVGQYLKSLNRNGYDTLRTRRVKGSNLLQDQTMFFLTAEEAQAWVEESIALRRLRGT